ncbi:MAG: hypothetical protein MR304_06570 [Eubacterium sp.]|nr:hypothetical protein [Eubacterium sp.]
MKDLQHFARRRNIQNGEDDLEEREQGQQYEPVAPAQQINESSPMEKEQEMDGSAGEPNTEEERKAYEKEKLDNLTEEDVREAIVLLKKYKEGKATLDRKIRANEEWWKLRHWGVVESEEMKKKKGMTQPTSAWLHNSINNKHADMMDNYPEPTVLAREESDDETAKILTAILPVVLEYNKYEEAYNDCAWYKLKQGTSVKKIVWDPRKNNGLGDIHIAKMDLLNLFWEPGINKIQESANLFHVELVDNNILRQQYPDLDLGGNDIMVTKYISEESIDTSDKTYVVDWYYKKDNGVKEILHYCKFVNETILYASENDPDYVESGYYDHGMYPYVFDVMFPEEGSPAGFGYIDIMKDPQLYIDKLDQVILDSSIKASKARYLSKDSGGINEEEFNDWTKEIVHYSGNPDDIQPIQPVTPPSICVSVKEEKINELKETSGNRDFSQGSTQSGVTAATAIAALQEAGSKLSRDMIRATYRAYMDECYMVIELIRQFYDEPRKFRILGEKGEQKFQKFDNGAMRPQNDGPEMGVDVGERLPVFDVTVSAAKKSTYSRMSQNELALQFYDKGFFAPGNADASLACLDMMEFDGKDKIIQKIENNGTLYQQLMALEQQVQQLTAMLGLQAQQVVNGGDATPPGEDSRQTMKNDSLGGATAKSERLDGAKEQANSMASV